MGRQLRIEYAGAVYHIMSRGNHQQAIFREDRDCELFLNTLGEACGRTGWRVHAYVLMGNHYHLLIETPEPNLVAGMRWMQGTYTKRFNIRHKEWGHLFQGRYKSLLIDGDAENYFSTVASYIHLNPAREADYDFEHTDLEDHAWSSYPAYLNEILRPNWLVAKRVLGSLEYPDTQTGQAGYQEYINRRTLEISYAEKPWETDEQWKKIRRGWYLGDKEFRDELVEKMDRVIKGTRRDSFYGEDIQLHDESEAERLIKEYLKKINLKNQDLKQLKKSDTRKKVIAWHVRRKTSVKNEWIANRLHMGHASNLSRYINEVETATEGLLQELKTTK